MRNHAGLWALFFLFLSTAASAQPATDSLLLQQVLHQADKLGLASRDIATAKLSRTYVDERTGIRYVYLQQMHQGYRVYNAILTVAMKDGAVLHSTESFIKAIGVKAKTQLPAVAAPQAVARAASHLQLPPPAEMKTLEGKAGAGKLRFSAAGIAKRPIETELVWRSADGGKAVQLAWNVNIDVLNGTDWWNVQVDAVNGHVIAKDNWTIHEAPVNSASQAAARTIVATKPMQQSKKSGNRFFAPTVTGATYNVIPFPNESPSYGSVAVESDAWLKAGAGNNATTHGWHYDGTSNFDITKGNNVFAYLDVSNTNTSDATNNWPAQSSTGIPALTFQSTPDLALNPASATNKKFAVSNLFYWNNILHDVFYQYGFTEPAGNFQVDNLGRGGLGNDRVLAEAQDGGGVNNANFTTPGDGASARMQMYLFSSPVMTVTQPAAIAGYYAFTESAFSRANQLAVLGDVTGQVVYYNDDASGTTHQACSAPANSVAGKIALIDRAGSCSFTNKVKNAQNAGAIAVIVVNSTSGTIQMTGTDNTITIPAVMISQANGSTLASQLANNVVVTLSANARDGDLDNGVISHEFGHGISNRLTGGALNSSCLGNIEQGGEGWSDYFALMVTTNWSAAQLTDGTQSRSVATYALAESATGPGIRRYPYSTNMAVNPLTYANMAGTPEVHAIGEIWCAALWDMTWNIIQESGSITTDLYNSNGTGGNAVALNLVMTGLKLQKCSPGFLDSRDAILAADNLLYNGAHQCAIWTAFARRGMGYSAKQGSSDNATDQVAATDLPSGASLTKSTGLQHSNSGNTITITNTITSNSPCSVPTENYVVRDTIPAGFSYVSSTGGTLNGNVVTFPSFNFSSSTAAQTYSLVLQANGGCVVDSVINDNREANVKGGLTSAKLIGSTDWTPSTNFANSGTKSWAAGDIGAPTDFVLTSASFTAGNFSMLSFVHYYNTEAMYDGGVVELSTDGGTTWIDAGPYMLQNAYPLEMASGTPLSGKKAFSGYSREFVRTLIDLSSIAGQTIRVRFRMTSDDSFAVDGWYVDD
ncbi:MAG TPA: M36 family metallopeptidase, partial [Flavisolibacter sp.]|nr:M36 family metallopeptidase [Flavisolibacter sp.]